MYSESFFFFYTSLSNIQTSSEGNIFRSDKESLLGMKPV